MAVDVVGMPPPHQRTAKVPLGAGIAVAALAVPVDHAAGIVDHRDRARITDRVESVTQADALIQQDGQYRRRRPIDPHVAMHEDLRLRVGVQGLPHPLHQRLEPRRRDELACIIHSMMQVGHLRRPRADQGLITPL